MNPLPDGFQIRLARNVRVSAAGKVLTGGSPLRVLFLGEEARALLMENGPGAGLTVQDTRSRALADKLLGYGMADPVFDAGPVFDGGPADDGDPVFDTGTVDEGACLREITVVIPVRDRVEALERLLGSLGSGKQVIVVDDASADPEAVARAAARHGAEYLPLEINVGPAEARNAGLRRVLTPYVAFIDSDVRLNPETLTRLARHFADPLVGLVAPRVLGHDAPDGHGWIRRYEDARSSLDLGQHSGLVHPRGQVSWLPAACLLARVEALGAGFSPGLRVAEDVDLVWSLVRDGWRVRYDAGLAVQHEHRTHLTAWLARKAFYGTGAHELASRHGKNVAPAVLAPWSAAMVMALLAQRRWSVPVAAVLAGVTVLQLAAKLRRSPHPLALAARLVGQGSVAALGQGSALALRHWWPLTLVGCAASSRIRRAVAIAAVVDAAVEYARTRPRLDFLRFAAARRLDDLAYGAGVWAGALRGRSPAALLPDITGLRRRAGGLNGR